MKLIRFGIVIIFSLLTACATQSSVVQTKADEATSLFKLRIIVDGKDSSAFLNNCRPLFTDPQGRAVAAWKSGDEGYYMVKTAAGTVSLTQVTCSSYKVVYNKSRRFSFNSLMFVAQSGSVNYAGDLQLDWTPERLAVSDMFNLGAFSDDKGIMVIKLDNNEEAARQFIQKTYQGQITLPVVTTLFTGTDLTNSVR